MRTRRVEAGVNRVLANRFTASVYVGSALIDTRLRKMSKQERKLRLLNKWIANLDKTIRKMVDPNTWGGVEVNQVTGPRVAMLAMDARDHTTFLKSFFTNPDHYHLCPFDFPDKPLVYLVGKKLVVEVAWPDDLVESDIPLPIEAMSQLEPNEFLVGVNGDGKSIKAALDNRTPHFLVMGWTGTGKTVVVRSMALQLSDADQNRIVLIDGKDGGNLRGLDKLPNVIGPVAFTPEDAGLAMDFVVREMVRWTPLSRHQKYPS